MSSQIEPTIEPRTKRGWRRLFRFRLLTLLILITVIAVLFGWWSHGARQQRDAVAAIENFNASFPFGTIDVRYDFENEGRYRPKYWPELVVDWVGVDYFSNVVAIRTNNTSIYDDHLEHLEGLPALKTFDLRHSPIADRGLKHLAGLKTVTWLNLNNTLIKGKGLKHLERFQALEWLFLSNTQVTDEGLEHLGGLKALRWLDLNETQVTDEGVARLQEKLPNCKIHY